MDKQLNIYDAIDVISNPKYAEKDRIKLSIDILKAIRVELFPIMEEIAKTAGNDSPHKNPEFTMKILEHSLYAISLSNGDENGLNELVNEVKGIIRGIEIAKEANRM